MDIAKFNEQLSTKIAKAKSYENHQDIEAAINVWLEISDMTLKASKQSNLDFSYKHMLISKTEQIFEHIKQLKAPKKDLKAEEKIIIEENHSKETESETAKNDLILTEHKEEAKNLKDDEWHKNIEIKDNLDTFKEIEAPKDFKILTPHDPTYPEKVKKLSENVDMNIFKKQSDQASESMKLPSESPMVCFACGAKLSPNLKVCPDCGTKLG